MTRELFRMTVLLFPGMDALRIYCAGPLFNHSERTEMAAIADRLTDAGFDVYLPHRDGMEFRLVHHELIERGWDAPTAGQFLHEAIFALDVYQLTVACGAMVWNLNGRVPDEGAVSEAAMAWMLGKPLVAYMDDVRSKIAGRINPLLVGMVDFHTVISLDEIVPLLQQELQRQAVPQVVPGLLPKRVQHAIACGETLWDQLAGADALTENQIIADCVERLFAPEAVPMARLNGSAVSPKSQVARR